MKNLCCVDCQI